MKIKNKKGDYRPLFFSLGFILFVGLLLPLIISSLVETPPISEVTGVMSPFVDFVDEGFCITALLLGEICINPFDLLGDTLKDYLVDSLITLSIIPNEILIPILILTTLGIIYTIIKLLPTT